MDLEAAWQAIDTMFLLQAKPQTQPAAPEDDEDEAMDYDDEEDDDEDLDLFGEATDEEKAARQKVIDEAKKRGEAKAKLTKSMIVLDVKPWDDTTGMAGHPVRSSLCVQRLMLETLLTVCCACRLVKAGAGSQEHQEGWPALGIQ